MYRSLCSLLGVTGEMFMSSFIWVNIGIGANHLSN
uniref:Uncharacterized protein n=1 Tax=Arundo donax TaxID=35708 RepID=A0A0A9BUT5_ARUDO